MRPQPEIILTKEIVIIQINEKNVGRPCVDYRINTHSLLNKKEI
jgi:hypothetical protein